MEFTIKNENSFIKFESIKFYDDSQDFEFTVNAKKDSFVIENKTVWANKIELLNFYKKLKDCYDKLKGKVESEFEYDEEIKLKISFKELGKVLVGCDFFEYGQYTNKCHIEFETDQTFVNTTLNELEEILK